MATKEPDCRSQVQKVLRERVVRDLAELEAQTKAVRGQWLDGRASWLECQRESDAAIHAFFEGRSPGSVRLVAEIREVQRPAREAELVALARLNARDFSPRG